MSSYSFSIRGAVQGVGFRPFVFSLAQKLKLKGYVKNTTEGAYIFINATKNQMLEFKKQLFETLPPLANIQECIISEEKEESFNDFSIVKSSLLGSKNSVILPDMGICKDCEAEFYDCDNFRFSYPFINCTNCGPRYSIIKTVPYDRVYTSMKKFKMCEICESEYKNPLNRRYHAQPISCSKCGPELSFYSINGKKIANVDVMSFASEKIKNGKVVAIKGIGGFHIMADARNDEVLQKIRDKKNRPLKPFAIMCPDLQTAKKIAYINQIEEQTISSIHKPIVLLKKKNSAVVSSLVAPNIDKIGIFLPYTPLHLLLFAHIDFPLIATSANLSGEPIIFKSKYLKQKLKEVVDYYVDYNRDIINASDDSVVQIIDSKVQILRASRSYMPKVFLSKYKTQKTLLAVGAELKNSICFYKDGQIIQSPYIGDMAKSASYDFFLRTVESFSMFYDLQIEQIITDKHPNFSLNQWAKEQEKPILKVQHHYAHIVSALFENNIDEKVLGISWDGTGYGDDGRIWGGEFFICDKKEYTRIAHFENFKLLGGDKSIKNIDRILFSILLDEKNLNKEAKDFLNSFDKNEKSLLIQMHNKNLNSPQTSSVGRIFDAFCVAICGLRQVSYDGQSGLMLEGLYDENIQEAYEFEFKNDIIYFKSALLEAFKEDKKVAASKFLNALRNTIIAMAKKYQLPVVLSGGVFQNKTLLEITLKKAKEEGLKMYYSKQIPTNDSGIALGQIVHFLETDYSIKNKANSSDSRKSVL